MNHPIIFSSSIAKELKLFFLQRKYTQIAVLVDENTFNHCYPIVKKNIPPHILIKIKSGEKNKNIKTCELVWKKLTECEFDRYSLVINIGGGVIGDLGGFCASVFKRGISFIHIPTTLLAQVDASIGGKLGIDFLHYKNQIGIFNEAEKIFIDSVFLKTLSIRELKSGFAEIIKHALIADKQKWNELIQISFSKLDWKNLILHSIQIKKQIVDQDPNEKNKRKILNFGHTIGHAIETYFLNSKKKKILHGEAIAAGIIIESYISYEKNGLDEDELKEITQYISKLYPIIKLTTKDIKPIIKLIHQDKKNKQSDLLFVLLKEIGIPSIDIKIEREQIASGIRYYKDIYTIK